MSTAFTEKGLKATFMAGMKSWPSVYSKLCTIVPSQHDSEKHAYLGAPPWAKEFLDVRQIQRLSEATYEITNKKYEATLKIDQDDLEDDTTGGLMKRAQQMGAYFMQHRDELVLKDLIDGAYATTCYDGQYFYDTDHADPEAEYSTSQDNDLTKNITTTTAPTPTEFHASLISMVSALRGFKDSRGKPVNPPGSKLWLEGPPNFEYIFARFCNSSLLTHDGATSEDNIWKGMLAGYIINPWTANTERFRLHNLAGYVKPFIFQIRKETVLQYLRADERNPNWPSFNEDANYFGAKARYNAGYGDWRFSVSMVYT
jgi:phage major head subunit gpT-like protein